MFPSKRSLFRALVYPHAGKPPSSILKCTTFKPLPAPSHTQARVKILLSPINPADINVLEGVYPAKPLPRSDLLPLDGSPQTTLSVAGNEAIGVIVAGEGEGLRVGDRVILDKSQLGVWATYANVDLANLVKAKEGVSDVAAATLRINPSTALAILKHVAKVKAGDWIIQNGANSAVGQAIIQVAAKRGVHTINLVRNRPDIDVLKKKLEALGATKVMTYEELAETSPKEVAGWTKPKTISLGLNCVSGPETTSMARYLGRNALLISYGAMSKAPLSLPTSYFIFKNLTSQGYWHSRWADEHPAERRDLYEELMDMVQWKELKEPDHEILTLGGSDEEVTKIVHGALETLSKGSHGKKIILKWDEQSHVEE